MSAIVNAILKTDQQVADAVDNYADDLIVNQDMRPVEVLLKWLEKYGLKAKNPEEINGARVLGLRVEKGSNGILQWKKLGRFLDP